MKSLSNYVGLVISPLLLFLLLALVVFGFSPNPAEPGRNFEDFVNQDCCDLTNGGKPTALVLSYIRSDCQPNPPQAGATCVDSRPVNTDLPNPALINVFTGQGQNINTLLFSGVVSEFQTFIASTSGNATYRPTTLIDIIDPETMLLVQQVSFHTSCSAPLIEGDRYGSIVLQGTSIKGTDCGSLGLSDWGDAGDTYVTTSGPNHLLTTDAPYLGSVAPDDEPSGNPDPFFAEGDDDLATEDEDGLLTSSITEKEDAIIDISYDNPSSEIAYIYAWLDLDQSGTFDIGERQTISVGAMTSGTVSLNFGMVPDRDDIQTFLRIRISTEQNAVLSPTGPAPNGEIEDHLVNIQQAILPIELADFDARIVEDHTEIKWATLTELNSDYFEVERSADGLVFETIGTVQSAGISNQRIEYKILDGNPISGINYYRLLSMDTDGSFTYSKVISVRYFEKEKSQSVIYPNPVSQDLTVVFATGIPDDIRLEIIDITGKAVQQLAISGDRISKSSSLEVNHLREGLYYLKVISAQGIEVLAFQKLN